MRNLVFLSTSVCRLHPAPITPSASQWPKPLRSPASGGHSEMGTRPGIGKRDVLPPPRLRRLPWPRGRQRAQRSRRWRSAQIQRQTVSGCLCSISCCGFSHDDFSGLGRACRPRNGLNWMVLVSPPERTGKDYDQHAPSTVYPSFAAERGIRRVDRAENTCRRSRRCVSTSRRRICRPCRR